MIIGLVGGMGSYAALKIFEKYLKIFEAEKEWDRPRFIIDNNCIMPSRVLAYETGYKKEELINSLLDSIHNLINSGCTHIFIGCNTCHLFLEDLFKKDPTIRNYIISMLDQVYNYLKNKNIHKLNILCTEATRKSKLYERVVSDLNIEVEYPLSDVTIRKYMEKIKAGKFKEIESEITSVLREKEYLFSGCTEFEYIDNLISPVEITLEYLNKLYKME